MIALSLTFAPKRIAKAAFVPEWLGVLAVFTFDALWTLQTDFRVVATWHDGLVISGAIVAMLFCRAFTVPRGAVMAEYFALTIAATMSFGIMSYLCMAHAAPLADVSLQHIDAALGFDWIGWFKLLFAHPAAVVVFRVLYDTLVYQGLYFCLFMSLLERKTQLREMFWLILVAGVFTSAGAFFWPALGPFETYGLQAHGPFLAEMQHLRSGQDMQFALHEMTGVVSFPSFHTTMALAYMWAFRNTGAIGWVVVGVNTGMLVAIPFFGGHYLIDMIAGVVVMALSWGAVKLWPLRQAVLPQMSQT